MYIYIYKLTPSMRTRSMICSNCVSPGPCIIISNSCAAVSVFCQSLCDTCATWLMSCRNAAQSRELFSPASAFSDSMAVSSSASVNDICWLAEVFISSVRARMASGDSTVLLIVVEPPYNRSVRLPGRSTLVAAVPRSADGALLKQKDTLQTACVARSRAVLDRTRCIQG